MVISQPPGIILHIIIVLHNCLNPHSWMLPETPYVLLTCNYSIRVTHRNGAIKHIFYESDPRRDHQQIVLYSFCRSCACFLHLAVRIFTSKSFCMKIWARSNIRHNLSVVFPQNANRTALCYATNTIKWKHSNIWHKSSNKTQGGQTRLKR